MWTEGVSGKKKLRIEKYLDMCGGVLRDADILRMRTQHLKARGNRSFQSHLSTQKIKIAIQILEEKFPLVRGSYLFYSFSQLSYKLYLFL